MRCDSDQGETPITQKKMSVLEAVDPGVVCGCEQPLSLIDRVILRAFGQ
jgi:hypothetical protein